MSRVANSPVSLPRGVEAIINGQLISVKGSKGTLEINVHNEVEVVKDENVLRVKARSADKSSRANSGTTRALLSNMVTGVSAGFEKKLQLIGVGYRAQVQGNKLNIQLGFSHPVEYVAPEGISFEVPSQTEIVIKGVDKQKVGQVAAEIRGFRPPEPYKGKGVRYATENVRRKEAKKK